MFMPKVVESSIPKLEDPAADASTPTVLNCIYGKLNPILLMKETSLYLQTSYCLNTHYSLPSSTVV